MAVRSVASNAVDPVPAARGRAADPVGLAWLVTGRWTTVAAAVGAVVAGHNALDAEPPLAGTAAVLSAIVGSNLWLWWRAHRRLPTPTTTAAALVSMDVVLLTWILLQAGGVLNPASVFYLVQIVLAALVLGGTWAWVVAGLSVAGYAGMFLAPVDGLRAAQVMHPEIALHMRGMWIAFALTAIVIAVLVTRLAAAIERRDRALETLRDRSARAARAQSLATAVAGAAHELSTPLATMAVAARELELAIAQRGGPPDHASDARLIRAEIDRCRAILDQMAGRIAEPMGEAPAATGWSAVLSRTLGRLSAADRARVDANPAADLHIVWPAGVIGQALDNLVRNALQASAPDGRVAIAAAVIAGDRVRISVTDRGAGMTPEQLARAGEPFFTTKPAGAGTGLGLYVTRASVEPLGGELRLTSAAGAGTTATIDLPRDVLAPGNTPHE